MGYINRKIIKIFLLPVMAAFLLFMVVFLQSVPSHAMKVFYSPATAIEMRGLILVVGTGITAPEGQLAIAIPSLFKPQTQFQNQGDVMIKQLEAMVVDLNAAVGCLNQAIAGTGTCDNLQLLPVLSKVIAMNASVRSIVSSGPTLFIDSNDEAAFLSKNTETQAAAVESAAFNDAQAMVPPEPPVLDDFLPILTVDGFGTGCVIGVFTTTRPEANRIGRELECCYLSAGIEANFEGVCHQAECGTCTIPNKTICDINCFGNVL